MNPQDLDKLIRQNQALRDAKMNAELEEFRRYCLFRNIAYIDSRLSKGAERECSIPVKKIKLHRFWILGLLRGIRSLLFKKPDYIQEKHSLLVNALRVRGFEVSLDYHYARIRVCLPYMPEVVDQTEERRQFAKVAFGLTDEQIDAILKGTADT